jgi:tetratricopeptide (TPR) repeat protein
MRPLAAIKNRKMDIEIAWRFFENNDVKKALDCFNVIIEQDKTSDYAFLGRGLCNHALLNIEASIADFTQSVELNPKCHEGFFNRGCIYLGKNEYVKANSDFKNAIDVYGENIDYFLNYVYANIQLKNHDVVIEYSLKLLEFDPTNLYAMEYLSHAMHETGEYEKSIEYSKKLSRKEPDNPDPYNNIGFSLLQMGKYKDAIKYFNTAIKLDPEFAYPYDNRGYCKYKLGQVEEGLNDIWHSLKLDPSNSFAFKYIGIIYAETGLIAEAISNLEKALELGYSEKYDNEAIELLEKIKSS